MQILDSLVDGAMQIPDPNERDAYIAALVVYLKTGIEPENLGPIATACWTMTFPVIENSRKKAENGKKGGEKAQANREANEVANGQAKREANEQANRVANREANEVANGQAREGRFASLSSSSSSPYGEKEESVSDQPGTALRLIREQQERDEREAARFESMRGDEREPGVPGPVADFRALVREGRDRGPEEAGGGGDGEDREARGEGP